LHVQQLLHLFLFCAIAVGTHHRPFPCHLHVNKLFFYPLKVLLPLLFGVHVFVMASVMCHLAPFYHYLCKKSCNDEVQHWLLSSPSQRTCKLLLPSFCSGEQCHALTQLLWCFLLGYMFFKAMKFVIWVTESCIGLDNCTHTRPTAARGSTVPTHYPPIYPDYYTTSRPI